jgi:hypothetical protein
MQRPQQGSGDKAMSEFEPVTYSYAQFYLVFALASSYIAMLMTGWGSGAEAKVRQAWIKREPQTPACFCGTWRRSGLPVLPGTRPPSLSFELMAPTPVF